MIFGFFAFIVREGDGIGKEPGRTTVLYVGALSTRLLAPEIESSDIKIEHVVCRNVLLK